MNTIEHFTVTPEYLLSQGFSLTLPRRFYSKIRFTDSCWLWTAATRHGYGCMWKGIVQGDVEQAHIVPDGDTRSCVNPAHLWLGTRTQNQEDMADKRRSASGERNGQCKLTLAQVEHIREASAKGEIQSVIGERFGITQGHVSEIVHFKRRKHS